MLSRDAPSASSAVAAEWRQCLQRHCRHTVAMHLLQSGVSFNVIALWLGHESTNTTHRYVEADLAMKEKALARLEPPATTMRRFKAPDSLMQFLRTL
jgi:site-specific recombinase XerD